MVGIVPYVIWAALIVTGLSILAIVLFGIRNLTYGKMDVVTIVLLSMPVVVLVFSYLIKDTWAEAAVFTSMILFAVTAISLLGSSIRGLLGI